MIGRSGTSVFASHVITKREIIPSFDTELEVLPTANRHLSPDSLEVFLILKPPFFSKSVLPTPHFSKGHFHLHNLPKH